MEIVLLGLGANMNEPLHAIRRAVDKIGKIEDTTLLETSSIYNTTPVSSIAQITISMQLVRFRQSSLPYYY